MILLDTNVVVAHLNGDAAVTAKISSHIEEIAVPALRRTILPPPVSAAR